jgi:hypothetical protein
VVGAYLRRAVGMAILLLQVGAIVYARFAPSRYFCWAPHDSQVDYKIAVTLDGKPLTDEQVASRYRLPPSGVEARSIEAVLSVVRQYEQTLGRGERAAVVVTYRLNGGEPQTWRLSAP